MVSVLFAAKDSVYKAIPGLDVWDEERDALKWPGGNKGIFHPPCRLFCRLKKFSTAPSEEKELAYWSVDRVRENGGVLEHPAFSDLWKDRDLPLPCFSDKWGFTWYVEQWWYGHPARKQTWLYFSGINPKDVPSGEFRLGYPEYVLGKSPFCGGSHPEKSKKKSVLFDNCKRARSATPKAFAEWLVKACEG